MTVQQERHSILDARQHAMSVCTTMIKGQSTVRVSTRKKCSNPKVWMMTRSGFKALFLLNFLCCWYMQADYLFSCRKDAFTNVKESNFIWSLHKSKLVHCFADQHRSSAIVLITFRYIIVEHAFDDEYFGRNVLVVESCPNFQFLRLCRCIFQFSPFLCQASCEL